MGNNPNRNQGASEAFEGVAPGARVQLTYRPRISDEEVELLRSRRRLAEEVGVPMAPPRALSPEAAAVLDQVRNAASADLLGHLAEHPEVAVRAAIAENPETPARTLLDLSKSFTVEVANNPVFPLLAFEVPDWLSRTSGLCVTWPVGRGVI